MFFLRIVYYYYRRIVRKVSNIDVLTRDKWIFLDNFFNKYSDLNDNLCLFEYALKKKKMLIMLFVGNIICMKN